MLVTYKNCNLIVPGMQVTVPLRPRPKCLSKEKKSMLNTVCHLITVTCVIVWLLYSVSLWMRIMHKHRIFVDCCMSCMRLCWWFDSTKLQLVLRNTSYYHCHTHSYWGRKRIKSTFVIFGYSSKFCWDSKWFRKYRFGCEWQLSALNDYCMVCFEMGPHTNLWFSNCVLSLSFLDRVQGAGGQNMRDRATIRRLNMYRQKERRWAVGADTFTPSPFLWRHILDLSWDWLGLYYSHPLFPREE